MDPKVADRLLDLLSTDNDFRKLFKKNPIAGLAQVGYPPAKEAIERMHCASVKEQLASKKEIAAAREELKAFLTSSAALTVIFCFEAGKVPSVIKRK